MDWKTSNVGHVHSSLTYRSVVTQSKFVVRYRQRLRQYCEAGYIPTTLQSLAYVVSRHEIWRLREFITVLYIYREIYGSC
jgi:hypothetical protein